MAKKKYIFGAGIQGQVFFETFSSLNIHIDGFIDSYSNKKTYNGLPVLRIENLPDREAEIYISVGLTSSRIKADLLSSGFENVFDYTGSVLKHPAIIHALKTYSLWYSATPSEMVNKAGIAKFRELLTDDKSRRLLDRIVAFRTDFSAENYIIPDKNVQYFPDDIDVFSGIERVRFVDAGAYTGDTVAALLKACEQHDTPLDFTACFEPDQKNLNALQNRVSALKEKKEKSGDAQVFVYPAGVWDRSEILTFSADMTASSCIVEGQPVQDISQAIYGLAIDDCLFNAAPNFIKMDIEGAERKALIGAGKTIKTYRPVLAICLYHKPGDLWELPLLIHQLAGDYNMHLRVYGDMLLETVLYCLPRPNPAI